MPFGGLEFLNAVWDILWYYRSARWLQTPFYHISLSETCNHYDDPMGLIVTRNIQYAKYQVSGVAKIMVWNRGWNLLFTWNNQTKWNLGYITWPTERFCRNCFQTAECLTTSWNRQDSVPLVLDEAGCSTGELCDLAHIPVLRKLNILPYRQISVFYVTKERVLCNTVLGKQLHAYI